MTCGDSGEEELLTRKSRQTEQALIFLQILEIKRIKKQTVRDSGLKLVNYNFSIIIIIVIISSSVVFLVIYTTLH